MTLALVFYKPRSEGYRHLKERKVARSRRPDLVETFFLFSVTKSIFTLGLKFKKNIVEIVPNNLLAKGIRN